MTRRVLLSDSDCNAVIQLQNSLQATVDDWEIIAVGTSTEALALLREQPFDAIAVGAEMEGDAGGPLLEQIAGWFPHTVRLGLLPRSGEAPEALRENENVVDLWLKRPFDPADFAMSIARIEMLKPIMVSPVLHPLVTGVDVLPTLPATYAELISELQNNNVSIARVSELIAEDMAISARVLQVVNSAYFSLRQTVTNVQQAVVLLGLDTVRALAQTASVFSLVESERTQTLMQELYAHAIRTGHLAKQVAQQLTENGEVVERATLAGMLHDIGKLILCTYVPQEYFPTMALAKASKQQLYQAEDQIFGASHAEMGAFLLGQWGFHNEIVLGVGYHHRPSNYRGPGCTVLTAVHIANMLAYSGAQQEPFKEDLLDSAYTERVGYQLHTVQ